MPTTPRPNGQQDEALDRLTRLQTLTASLLEAMTSEQVADAILTQSLSVLGANAGVLYLLSDDASEFVWRGKASACRLLLRRLVCLAGERDVSGWFPAARADVLRVLERLGFARQARGDFQGRPSYLYHLDNAT